MFFFLIWQIAKKVAACIPPTFTRITITSRKFGRDWMKNVGEVAFENLNIGNFAKCTE